MRALVTILLCLLLVSCASASGANDTNTEKTGKAAEPRGRGDIEVERMLGDAPQLSRIILKSDIRMWLRDRFDGKSTGYPIRWNQAIGIPNCYSEPRHGREASISIRTFDQHGQPIEPEALLSSIVYQLLDIQNADSYMECVLKAYAGRVSQRQLIQEVGRQAYQTAQSMRSFYTTHWLPQARQLGLKPNPDLWYADLPNYDTWDQTFSQSVNAARLKEFFQKAVEPAIEANRRHKQMGDFNLGEHGRARDLPVLWTVDKTKNLFPHSYADSAPNRPIPIMPGQPLR